MSAERARFVQKFVIDDQLIRLAKGAGVGLAGKLGGRALHVLGHVVLARHLGPASFGIYAIGWSVFRILEAIAPLGLNHGVVRFGSHHYEENRSILLGLLVRSLLLALCTGLLFACPLFVLAPWLAHNLFHTPDAATALRFFAVMLPLSTALQVAAAATRTSQRMKFSTLSLDVIPSSTNLILVVAFYLLGWGLAGALWARLLSFLIGLSVVLHYLMYLFPGLASRHTAGRSTNDIDLLRFSLPTAFAGLFGALTIWLDRLFVAHFCSTSSAGIYQAASQCSILFAIILSAFSAVFAPMIAELHNRGEIKILQEIFAASTKWGLYLSLPFVIVFCVRPTETLTAVYGYSYVAGAHVLVVLTLAQFLNVATGSVGFILIMSGRQSKWLWLSAAMISLNGALNFVLIPLLGPLGAALATAVAVSGLFLTGLYLVRLELGMWPYNRSYIKGLLASAVAAAALSVLHFIPLTSPHLIVVLSLLVCWTAFSIVLGLLRLDREDRRVVQFGLSRLRVAMGLQPA